MKAIFFALLVLSAFCLKEEFHYFHYKEGHIIVDKEKPVKTTGPIFLEFLNTMNITSIAGMHSQGNTYTPFEFAGKVVSFKREGDRNFQIVANCTEGAWGMSLMKLQGQIHVNGQWKGKIHYHGSCVDLASKKNYTVEAQGEYSSTPFYLPAEAAVRAQLIVGQSDEAFKPVNVLNFAVIGYTYINMIKNCTFYAQFKNATESKPGYVVLGNDGAHCAVVDKEGDKFIHSNPAKKQVTMNPMSMLKDFFKNGYTFKLYP